MLDYSQKKKTRKFMYSVPVLCILLVVFCFLASRAFLLYQKEIEVRNKTTEVEADLANIKKNYTALEKRNTFLNTPRGKEEEMRNRSLIGKDGEGVIMVVDEKSTTTANSQPQKPLGWWGGFLNFFR